MKILYITNYKEIFKQTGGFINDYLNDLTFYGLYELYKLGIISELVDSTPIICLYKQNENKISQKHIWGGMTSVWLIDNDTVDRSNIVEKIKDKYYDYIIYGASRRCLDYYDIVSKAYDPKKIIILDGNDDVDINNNLLNHVYFKRELHTPINNILPISFSYPTNKITNTPIKNKSKDFAHVIPGDKSTYIFKNEQDYYNDYNISFFGVTTRKAGWDCMRHYEILGNYCLPYFIDIDECPYTILTQFPKDIIKKGMKLANSDNFDENIYYNLLDDAFETFKNKSTTQKVAKYILESI